MARSRKKEPLKVLVVCHANQWRSPLAAAALALAAGEGAVVRSAGFRHAGRRAARRVRLAAALLGYDLEGHLSRLVDAECLAWADAVVYMDGGNRARLADAMRAHGVARPYSCLGAFCHPPRARIADLAFISDRRAFFMHACVIVDAARACADRARAGDLGAHPWEVPRG